MKYASPKVLTWTVSAEHFTGEVCDFTSWRDWIHTVSLARTPAGCWTHQGIPRQAEHWGVLLVVLGFGFQKDRCWPAVPISLWSRPCVEHKGSFCSKRQQTESLRDPLQKKLKSSCSLFLELIYKQDRNSHWFCLKIKIKIKTKTL